MKRIWKYPIPITDDQIVLAMPKEAKILALQTQRGAAMIWVLVDPQVAHTDRFFRVYGTGHDMPDVPGIYVGTWQMLGGALVFHLFEEEF